MPRSRRPRWSFGALLLVSALAAAPAGAGDFYLGAGLGISWANGDANGGFRVGATRDDLTDSGSDESPAYGGVLGFEWELDEVVPWWEWVPPWDMQFEFEGTGRSDWEIDTEGDVIMQARSTTRAWTAIFNFGMEVPVHTPIAALFGRIAVLEPLSLYAKAGVGVAGVESHVGLDGLLGGADKSNNFAWQAGGGIAYELAEAVDVLAGYRYVDFGAVTMPLEDVNLGTPPDRGAYQLELSSHELTTQLRIKFYSIRWPGRKRM